MVFYQLLCADKTLSPCACGVCHLYVVDTSGVDSVHRFSSVLTARKIVQKGEKESKGSSMVFY